MTVATSRPAEESLVPAGEALARKVLGSEMRWLAFEPRVGGRRPDVVASNRDRIVAIELKVDDWRVGLAQAATNLAFADYSYLAVWREALGRVDREAARALGVGIAVVDSDGGCDVVARAQRSRATCALTRYELLKSIAQVCDA